MAFRKRRYQLYFAVGVTDTVVLMNTHLFMTCTCPSVIKPIFLFLIEVDKSNTGIQKGSSISATQAGEFQLGYY